MLEQLQWSSRFIVQPKSIFSEMLGVQHRGVATRSREAISIKIQQGLVCQERNASTEEYLDWSRGPDASLLSATFQLSD